MKLSGAQRFVKWFVSSSKFEKIMAESKQWKFNCDCGQSSSIWDIGGVRAGARGNKSSNIKCPHCKKSGMRKLWKDG